MIVKHARSGKLTANIYTDGWPDFTTTVCHILSPALSDVSSGSTSKGIFLYSPNSQDVDLKKLTPPA